MGKYKKHVQLFISSLDLPFFKYHKDSIGEIRI